MKNLSIILAICIPVFLMSCGGAADSGKGKETKKEIKVQVKDHYEPGEYAAQQVLLAYATKNLNLLKEYASGMMRMALDEEAMERPDFEKQLKAWDGSIKEVRYSYSFINFEHIYYAHAHYSTDKDDPNKIYLVVIQSRDQENWVITVNPLLRTTLEEFQNLDTVISELKEEYD